MQSMIYKQKSLQQEIIDIFDSFYSQTKKFLYKHHRLLAYF